MKMSKLHHIMLLTIGWFGIEMALALDATQFQILLDERFTQVGLNHWALNLAGWQLPFGKATLIGLVLSFGPLAGIIVQPLMGWLGDRLILKGIHRQAIMKQSVWYALVCTLLFTIRLPLWGLVLAIALFFISFNVLNVNYRALITETSHRKSLTSQKGMVSGFVALFSGFGGFCMFMLFRLFGNSPWPAALSALILFITFAMVFTFAPKPKMNSKASHSEVENGMVTSSSETNQAHHGTLLSVRHIAFYLIPIFALWPDFEKRLIHSPSQKPIFRLFMCVFFAWLGIQALRAFFILFAVKEIQISYENANLALAILTLVTVASSLPLGKLADRLDNPKLLTTSLAVFAMVCLLGYWGAYSLGSIMLLTVFLGASFAGMLVLPMALLLKACPLQGEGTYSGLYNLFISMPQLYSLFITGWLADCFGYRVILLVAAVTVACAALLSLRLNGRTFTMHSALSETD